MLVQDRHGSWEKTVIRSYEIEVSIGKLETLSCYYWLDFMNHASVYALKVLSMQKYMEEKELLAVCMAID